MKGTGAVNGSRVIRQADVHDAITLTAGYIKEDQAKSQAKPQKKEEQEKEEERPARRRKQRRNNDDKDDGEDEKKRRVERRRNRSKQNAGQVSGLEVTTNLAQLTLTELLPILYTDIYFFFTKIRI